jgi:K+-transporting ATPase KdpF subunit
VQRNSEDHHAGHLLRRRSRRLLRAHVGLHQSRRAPVGEAMEYAISGIAAVFLFVYLLYALLKPERF